MQATADARKHRVMSGISDDFKGLTSDGETMDQQYKCSSKCMVPIVEEGYLILLALHKYICVIRTFSYPDRFPHHLVRRNEGRM